MLNDERNDAVPGREPAAGPAFAAGDFQGATESALGPFALLQPAPSVSVPVGGVTVVDGGAKDARKERLPRKNNLFLMGVLAAVFCVMGAAVVFPSTYDNDVWFLMATGREIVENGFFYTNPFSMHEGLGIVVQQWLVCVWLYLLYTAGGFVATGLWVVLVYGAFVYSAYRLGRLLRGNADGGEWLLAVLLVVSYCMTYYMAVRPHLYSMIVFVWTVFFLEKYRRGASIAWLVPIPFMVAVHVNLQAAIAPFDLVIVACYLVPDFLKPLHDRGRLAGVRFADARYARLPLLVVLVASAAALLANPYLVDGALYLVNSYGSAEYGGYIAEMSDFAPAGSVRFALVLVVLLVACACVGKAGLRGIDLPLVLLLAGTTYMAFDHVRNIWLLSLFSFMVIARLTSDATIPWPARLARVEMACVVPIIVGVAASAVLALVNVPKLAVLPNDDSYTPVAAMDYLDECGMDKETTKVFTFFNAGGYIEWRGYKVNMDPRPEIWASAITGSDFDFYEEYVDMAQGTTVFNEYMDKYDFDVFVLPSDEDAASLLSNDWDYMKLPGGSDYVAFAKRSLVSHDASEAEEIELPQ